LKQGGQLRIPLVPIVAVGHDVKLVLQMLMLQDRCKLAVGR